MKNIAKYVVAALFVTVGLAGVLEATAGVFLTVQKDWNLFAKQDWVEFSPALG